MPEIPFKEFKRKLKVTGPKDFPQVCLVHGEEFLYKGVLDAIVDFLVPESSRTLNYDPMDGADENIPRALERVNTYSLIPGVKVVALKDSRIFYSRQDKAGLIEKAKSRAENNELKKASGYFITLLGMLNLTFDDLDGDNRYKRLGIDKSGNSAWLDKLLAYCEEQNLSAAAQSADMAGMLIQALENGFPAGHHLVITADMAAKAHRLYKSILERGWVVDCSVPKGESRADKVQQESVLSERMKDVLSRAGKTMAKDAYRAMLDMIGFDIRAFVNDLEKLVNYVGDRDEITLADVQSVLKRTRQDPIFEFTNAVVDRDLEKSLFFLGSMIAAGSHPLQLLTAVANQVRRLLSIKGFVVSPQGAVWRKGAAYNYFQRQVMPAAIEHDRFLTDCVERWEEELGAEKAGAGGKGGKKKAVARTDLLIVKNPKSPFPVYNAFKKSDNFSLRELKESLRVVADADMLLKSTAQNPTRVLENVLFKICGI